MAPKRSHDGDGGRSAKKHNKGFSVGPANLPDGTHRRKVQKIKKGIIHKAKLKKEYAKLKAREDLPDQNPAYYGDDGEHEGALPEDGPEPSMEPHPDRVKMLQEPSPEPQPEQASGPRRKKRPRPQPFQKEAGLGRQKKEMAEAQRIAREEAETERARKLAERERFRKAMAKARHGGLNGQRKLGRESIVLLEKARRLTGKS
ncbi:hypothetical protein BU23DRAFT_270083 [Bimuria novae-zelandiae CBS 107.79]|uniref:rRNA-processing protein FYV7 n=1 Tax=Bimuria novae-zelandiae CBS 107.79 TaxID=1447943 RepID=A0A6A5UTT4_9PLEO|nr:hypothetical protein BU23DRAFT_270083 [Bimuria novae-zelandiae CBS 107.79]